MAKFILFSSTVFFTILAISRAGNHFKGTQTLELQYRLGSTNDYRPRGYLDIHYSGGQASSKLSQKNLTTEEFDALQQAAEKGEEYTLRILTYPGGDLWGEDRVDVSNLIRTRLSEVILLNIGVSGDITLTYYGTAIVPKSEATSSVRAYNTSVYFVYEHHQNASPNGKSENSALLPYLIAIMTLGSVTLILEIASFVLVVLLAKKAYQFWKVRSVLQPQLSSENADSTSNGRCWSMTKRGMNSVLQFWESCKNALVKCLTKLRLFFSNE